MLMFVPPSPNPTLSVWLPNSKKLSQPPPDPAFFGKVISDSVLFTFSLPSFFFTAPRFLSFLDLSFRGFLVLTSAAFLSFPPYSLCFNPNPYVFSNHRCSSFFGVWPNDAPCLFPAFFLFLDRYLENPEYIFLMRLEDFRVNPLSTASFLPDSSLSDLGAQPYFPVW